MLLRRDFADPLKITVVEGQRFRVRWVIVEGQMPKVEEAEEPAAE